MLIMMYCLMAKYALPIAGKCISDFIEMFGPMLVVLAGIIMIFGAVGFSITQNLGATIVGGCFKAVAYFGKQILKGAAWVLASLARLVPMVFVSTKRAMSRRSKKTVICNLIAGLVTIAFIAVVI